MHLTLEQLQAILPDNPSLENWIDAVNTTLPEYGIDTPERISAFISQTGHESNSWTVLEENLNYSAKGLRATFPKYFTETSAAQYARKPEMIANRVYANRMGNGPEVSGDGWKFKGKGILQITGCSNYTKLSQYLFQDDSLLDNPDLLLEPEYALRSALWYWDINNLNAIADSSDITLLTKRINGGTHGLSDRADRYNLAIEILTA